jgi:hypothetical protein
MRVVSVGSAAIIGAAVALATSSGPALAAANDACPAGFQTISVAQAVSEGYTSTPVLVDSPDHGGNSDGIVCRRPIGDGQLKKIPNPTVDQLYFWHDNSTPRKF